MVFVQARHALHVLQGWGVCRLRAFWLEAVWGAAQRCRLSVTFSYIGECA